MLTGSWALWKGARHDQNFRKTEAGTTPFYLLIRVGCMGWLVDPKCKVGSPKTLMQFIATHGDSRRSTQTRDDMGSGSFFPHPRCWDSQHRLSGLAAHLGRGRWRTEREGGEERDSTRVETRGGTRGPFPRLPLYALWTMYGLLRMASIYSQHEHAIQPGCPEVSSAEAAGPPLVKLPVGQCQAFQAKVKSLLACLVRCDNLSKVVD
ncbi:hypothetical protein M430DRAFT_167136 [Amorphotheca resinae ATCC 22711]|uniref:Uncharacterized protein n=1 Tax=Amorphotheca resinae ATCC 22711 TaxID=857342 RepID=A0A2T3BGL2_AMORE|nr:hypothetical protein M430DRAFT_167136 [Amorphotheca resinae ATCC 22711]PSS28443.1 hypothetical protein M430DRAFT_167136 [Amorphotheca resinae ATCC 22711]